MSPHLIDIRERIRLDGQLIPQEKYLKYFWEVWDKLTATMVRLRPSLLLLLVLPLSLLSLLLLLLLPLLLLLLLLLPLPLLILSRPSPRPPLSSH